MPVVGPTRVGLTDAQAGLPACRLRLRLPGTARCTRGQWPLESGCGPMPAACSRRRVRGGLSPPSRAGMCTAWTDRSSQRALRPSAATGLRSPAQGGV
jgi:hypothetical protein